MRAERHPALALPYACTKLQPLNAPQAEGACWNALNSLATLYRKMRIAGIQLQGTHAAQGEAAVAAAEEGAKRLAALHNAFLLVDEDRAKAQRPASPAPAPGPALGPAGLHGHAVEGVGHLPPHRCPPAALSCLPRRVGSNQDMGNPCNTSYFAPLMLEALVPGFKCDYNVYLMAGSVERMRARFAALHARGGAAAAVVV